MILKLGDKNVKQLTTVQFQNHIQLYHYCQYLVVELHVN